MTEEGTSGNRGVIRRKAEIFRVVDVNKESIGRQQFYDWRRLKIILTFAPLKNAHPGRNERELLEAFYSCKADNGSMSVMRQAIHLHTSVSNRCQPLGSQTNNIQTR
jgi:hypothetical protein